MLINALLEPRIVQGLKFTTKLNSRGSRGVPGVTPGSRIRNAIETTTVITYSMCKKPLALLRSVHENCHN